MNRKRVCLMIALFTLILPVIVGHAAYAEEVPNEGTSENVVTITLDQRGVLAEDRATKLFGGPGRYLPTGIYKEPNKPLIVTVSSTDQETLPRVVISDPILQSSSDGNNAGIQLKEGRNVISPAKGGIVHVINESHPTHVPPTLTIEGGHPFTYFVLGEHTLEDWHQMLTAHREIPAIELVGERVLITASYNTAKDIDDPIRLLELIDEVIEVQNKVSGLDKNSPNSLHWPSQYRQHMRENNSPGVYMYMTINHTGYNSSAMKRILHAERFKENGWGPWHELGHTYQQGPWKWSGVGEVTVNIYSMSVQRHFGNRSNLADRYDQAFAHFNNPNRDYNAIDDFYHKLVMFWQLDLAFGEDFYPALHRAYREVPQSEQPATDQEKIQQFIVTASEVANHNLTPFFEMWGLDPTRQTKEQISHLQQLTQPIWWLTDDGLKLPPVSLGLGNSTERLDLLTGTPLTDVTTVRIDDRDIKLEKVTVLIDGEETAQSGGIPASFTLRPTELTRGNHSIRVIADDSQGRRYTSTAYFLIEHFDLVTPTRTGQGVERLRGRVTIAVDPIIPAKDILNVTAQLRPVSSELDGTDSASSGEYLLFDATFLPVRFPVNTLVFPDGPYDLVISAKTIDGVVSELLERVLLDNYVSVEDQILPPQDLAWFGTRNALKTVTEPEGWAYAGGDPDIFFGDQDRIRREGTGAQHLTWHVPNIYRYALTIYAQNSRIKDDVLVQVFSDGELWTTLDYAIDVTHSEDSEQPLWLKLDLTGTVPRDLSAEFLRVVFRDGDIPKEALQLGHVFLEGVRDQAILDFLVYQTP